MPEGPEVKSLINKLRKYTNKNVEEIKVISGRYKTHGVPKGWKEFSKQLPLEIEKIDCHGKFIWWKFKNSDLTMWNTLGMSGWWTTEDVKHNNVMFLIDGVELYFNDTRNFGTIMFQNQRELEKKLNSFGPDVLKKDGFELFKKRLGRKRKDGYIGAALLDQKVFAGVGNYMRSDALYLSKISPFRILNELTDKELETVFNNCKLVAEKTYNNLIGKKIELESEIKGGTDFVIYSKKEDKNGNKVKKEKLGERTVHWVPNVQK